jgi:hypothetical protein
MFFDLLLAAAATLVLGLPVFIWPDALPTGVWEIPIVVASLALSLGVGVAILARHHRARIVPIASIYVAVMFGVLICVAFVIGWHLGRVDL